MSDSVHVSNDGKGVIETRRRNPPRWLLLVIAGVFALFYAYDVWAAIGNLVGLNGQAHGLDTELSAFAWIVLIGAILIPVLVYVLAYRLGRNRAFGVQALTLLVGLALVSVLSLDITLLFGLGNLIV